MEIYKIYKQNKKWKQNRAQIKCDVNFINFEKKKEKKYLTVIAVVLFFVKTFSHKNCPLLEESYFPQPYNLSEEFESQIVMKTKMFKMSFLGCIK